MLDWANLDRYSVNMRQFIDFRQSTLPDGQRIVEAYNSSGLTFTILPDRGLDLWTAHYNGRPLTWISQGAPHAPDFGLTWLQQFNGGLLATCGLTHAGPPEIDDQTGVARDLHGRYSRLRAGAVAVEAVEVGDDYTLTLSGEVTQSALFGEQLVLERTYMMVLGKPGLYIEDTITNMGDEPAPFMILYHFNFGYPLIAEGTRLLTPHECVYARDAEAQVGFDRWADYQDAVPSFAEQVYFHHLKAENGTTEVLLYRDNLGLAMRWQTDELPYLTQWKNTRQGLYVCGVEPGNCIPEGQNAARKKGRLVELPPGESQQFRIQLDILDAAEEIQASQAQIERLQQTGTPVPNCQLDDYA
jgi:galactose mutarotase-like enzyme